MNFLTFLKEEKLSSSSITFIPHLKDMGEYEIDTILSKPLVIVEKVDGAKFSIIKTKNGDIQYWSKNNRLDKAMRIVGQWDILISRLEELRQKTNNFKELPNNSEISGEFFRSAQSNTLQYSQVPKGNFVVFYAKLNGKEYNSLQYKELWKWADYFNSARQPVLFSGKLKSEQVSQLKNLLKVKGSHDFIANLLNIIKPGYKTEIEGIVIYSGQDVVKIVDPHFTQSNKERWTKSKEIYDSFRESLLSLILKNTSVKLIENLKDTYKFDLSPLEPDDKYIYMIDKIFLLLAASKEFKILAEKFKTIKSEDNLNDTHVSARVMGVIEKGPVYKELYKLLLLIFRKEKKKRSDIFKTVDLNQFNSLVKSFNTII